MVDSLYRLQCGHGVVVRNACRERLGACSGCFVAGRSTKGSREAGAKSDSNQNSPNRAQLLANIDQT